MLPVSARNTYIICLLILFDNYILIKNEHYRRICRNPYNPLCLAPYGGPVDPSVALGGFSNNSSDPITKTAPYNKATSLVLTFVLNNNNNKSLLINALEWENK